MTDIHQRTAEPGAMDMQEGDDFVCPNCGCEIRLRHHGDPAKMQHMQAFVCCCGTRMDKEQRPA
jgi:hypothetical protein